MPELQFHDTSKLNVTRRGCQLGDSLVVFQNIEHTTVCMMRFWSLVNLVVLVQGSKGRGRRPMPFHTMHPSTRTHTRTVRVRLHPLPYSTLGKMSSFRSREKAEVKLS